MGSYTAVKLSISRKGRNRPIEITIIREVINVKSVRSRAEGNDVGYIRITEFTEQTTDLLKTAIRELTRNVGADNIKGFVIDLRNNPGGLFDQAVSVAASFLDSERWSQLLRQPAKVDSPMRRTNHHEDAQTVFG